MFIYAPFVLSYLLVLFSILEDVQKSIALLSIDLQTQKDEALKVKIAKPATAGTFYLINMENYCKVFFCIFIIVFI